jgi:agmatinase
VIPVPFDATTSYRKGTAHGPAAVLAASRQVDLFDLDFGRPYETGIAMLEPDSRIAELQEEASELAGPILELGGAIAGERSLARSLARVNAIGAQVNEIVRAAAEHCLEMRKLPVVLGGDHAAPFGAIEAAAARHPGLGILHFDAHADLREAYEGFTWSHASILFNVMQRLGSVAKLVQVGIRDLSGDEHARITTSSGRIRTLYDRDWARARMAGADLRTLVREHLALLPREIWVSFDVDGLDPTLCPSTGTPVPGGLSWHEVMLWLEELARSEHLVVGLDLNEVSPGEKGDPDGSSWDAIVGARLLYKLIGAALAGRARLGSSTTR